MVVLVLASMATGVVPAAATHDTGWCARTLDTITIGTGNVAIDIDALAGVNHWDIPHPDCSAGRFWLDHSSEPALTEQHCAEGFLRVYASPGEAGVEFVLNWLPSSPAGCA